MNLQIDPLDESTINQHNKGVPTENKALSVISLTSVETIKRNGPLLSVSTINMTSVLTKAHDSNEIKTHMFLRFIDDWTALHGGVVVVAGWSVFQVCTNRILLTRRLFVRPFLPFIIFVFDFFL